MSDKKRISDFDQVSTISDDDEFILVDKSNTTDLDASSTGKTVKVSFADLKTSVGTQGQKGEIGVQGLTGQKGDVGPTGLTGTTGPTGPTGEKGQKGEPGDSSGNVTSNLDSYLDILPASTSQMVEAFHMGPNYPYAATTFESDGTPTNWIYQQADALTIDGFYKRYPNSNYNYSDSISGEESRIMRLKENGVFDFICTTSSIPSSDRVDHDLLFYDYYDNYIGKWKFYSSGSNYIIELYDNNETLVYTFQDRPWMRGSTYGGGRIAGTFKIKDNKLNYFPVFTSIHSKYHGGTEMLTEDIPNWTSTHIKSIKVVIHNVKGTHPAAYGWLKVGNGYNSCLFDYHGDLAGVNSWRSTGEFIVY